MMHWLHMLSGRGRRLAAYATGELPPPHRGRVERFLAACPACRREAEAYAVVSAGLRRSGRAVLTPEEAAAFWPAVERRIRRGVPAAGHPTRPSLRELFWDYPRLSLASAATAALLVVGLALGPLINWGLRAPASSGVEVVSVEAGENASVILFQAPGSSLKVIWVFETPSS